MAIDEELILVVLVMKHGKAPVVDTRWRDVFVASSCSKWVVGNRGLITLNEYEKEVEPMPCTPSSS